MPGAVPALRELPGWKTPAPLEQRRLQSYLALLLGDIAALVVGFAAAGWLYLGPAGLVDALLQAQLILPVFLTIALYNGAYSLSTLEHPATGVIRAIAALGLAFAIVVFIAFYAKTSAELSRFAYSLGVGTAALAMIWLRFQLRAFVRWRCKAGVVNQLLIDDDGPAVSLPDVPTLRVAVYGLKPDLSDPAALDLIGLALRHVDQAIVSCPPERRAIWAMILKGANISGEIVSPEVATLDALGARQLDGTGLLQISIGPLGLRARAAKRLLDVLVSATGLLLLLPVLLLVGLVILLGDGRPVLFAQQRVGRANRFFTLYKFRSMQHVGSGENGAQSARRGDPRLTRVGRWLRRSSIDELPQLFNVLRGEMSLVGPRPHALGSRAGDKLFWEIDPRYWQRHALKPGMTGLAQVRGLRGATDFEADLAGRLSADLEYISGWSLGRDLAIIFSTLRVLMHDRAY